MRPIFISYRRDDTEGQAGRLFQDLREVFGAENVFMDVATIEPGVDFRRVIEKNTESCGVLLALVGRQWLTATDAAGRRRLDEPNDFVRLETAAALKRDIPLVPVLLQGARMPRPEELPEELRDFAFRNSVELSHARWESDVQILIAALRKVLAQDAGASAPASAAPASPQVAATVAAPLAAPVAPGGSRPTWLWVAGAVAGVAALGGWLGLRGGAAPTTPAPSAIGAPAASAAAVPLVPPSAPERGASASATTAAEEAARREAARKAAAKRAEEQRRAEQAKQAEAARQAEAAEQARQAEAAKKAEEQRAADEARRAQEAREAQARRQEQIRAHNDGICLTGFVWRDARPGDKVCVTPDTRSRTAAENRAAASTRSPTGGAYGPNTCKSGFVWREAYAGDAVCVVPSSRQQAASDNAQGPQRVVPLPR
jgi:hypothetical protein